MLTNNNKVLYDLNLMLQSPVRWPELIFMPFMFKDIVQETKPRLESRSSVPGPLFSLQLFSLILVTPRSTLCSQCVALDLVQLDHCGLCGLCKSESTSSVLRVTEQTGTTGSASFCLLEPEMHSPFSQIHQVHWWFKYQQILLFRRRTSSEYQG